MTSLRKWLLGSMAGTMSLALVACGAKPPTTSLTPVEVPSLTPVASTLPTDTNTGDAQPADETGGDTSASDTAATPSDTTASPTAAPSAAATATPTPTPTPTATATADPSPTPSPTATPTPSPTPTPTPAATPNPLGNDSLDGFGDGKLNAPAAMTITGGEVYVTDLDTSLITEGRVQVFGTDGTWRRTVKAGAFQSALPKDLTGVAMSGPTLLLANANATGGVTTYLNSKFSQWGIGTKNNAAALAVDSWGSVYVANTSQSCVSKFSVNGDTQSYYFVNGVNAKGLAFDNANNLYVADGGTGAVRIIKPDGQLKADITTGISTIGSVAVDKSNGAVYVVDQGRKQIKRFSQAGDAVQTFGAGVLSDPQGLAVDDTGVVFVVDGKYGAKKIFRFAPAK